jgi:hypothetical protein
MISNVGTRLRLNLFAKQDTMDVQPYEEESAEETQFRWIKPIGWGTLVLTVAPYLYAGCHVLTGHLDLSEPTGNHGPWYGSIHGNVLAGLSVSYIGFFLYSVIFLTVDAFWRKKPHLDGCLVVVAVAVIQIAGLLVSVYPGAILMD